MSRSRRTARRSGGRAQARATALALWFAAGAAHASMFQGETLDKVADVLAIVVLIVVPIVAITVFWMVHVLPEKIAHKRHHPQIEAIKTLCLLSLVFGGLLWPLAWLWAYTKPVLHRLAYGTDKHEDYFKELAQKDAEGAKALEADIDRVRRDVDRLYPEGDAPPELQSLRDELAALEARLADRLSAGAAGARGVAGATAAAGAAGKEGA